MAWIVELGGDQHTLSELEESFREEAVVVLVDGKYRLPSELFSETSDYAAVKIIAEREVEYLNGYLRVFLPGRRPIATSHIHQQEPGKPKVAYVTVTESLAVSARLVGLRLGDDEGILEVSQPGPGFKTWRTIIQNNQAMADVFEYMKKPLNDWSNLGRTLEVIEHDFDDRDALIATGWIDEESLKRFHATANNPVVAGATARHGARKYKAPKQPMGIDEARTMVISIVRQWIEEKLCC